MTVAERLLLLSAIAAVLIIAGAAVRAWSARRLSALRARPLDTVWSTLGQTPDGRPGLVVFSAPLCVACRTAQEPAVRVLEAEYRNALRVVHIDIAARPKAARAFNILTAPSTVILGPDGRVSAVNQGFASADRLRAQLTVASASPA